MRVMVFVKATADTEKGRTHSVRENRMMEEMGRFNDKLRDAGVLVMAEGLGPSSQGKRVAFDGDKRTVSDGPFAHPEELVAGFWIWEVKDITDAVEWVKQCPNPAPGPSVIEIRPM